MPRHGSNIKRTQGGRWQASYRLLNGKEVSKTFDRHVDADSWRRQGIEQRDRPQQLDPRAGRVTVREYGERWRAAQLQHRPTTRALVDSVLHEHVYPHLGSLEIGRVLPSDVQALVKRWQDDGAAPSTIRQARWTHVRSMFAAAVRDGVIATTPCTGSIRLPEIVTTRPVPLTATQVQHLADAIDPRYRAMVLLGFGTGPRISEARGLTLGNVDFLGREIAYTQQLGPKPPYPFSPLKNSRRSPSRVVPAPAYVLEALSEHLRLHGTGERDLLFTTIGGKPVGGGRFSMAWRAATRAAGLPDSVTYHHLRHSYASEALVQGLSVVEVAELIGDTVTQVERTYGHPTVDFRRRARLAVEAIWTAREPVAEPMRTAGAVDGHQRR